MPGGLLTKENESVIQILRLSLRWDGRAGACPEPAEGTPVAPSDMLFAIRLGPVELALRTAPGSGRC
jgi:hypothetical protein